MIWSGICVSGKTLLLFVDRGVKVNQQVYRSDVLVDVVLPSVVPLALWQADLDYLTGLRPGPQG